MLLFIAFVLLTIACYKISNAEKRIESLEFDVHMLKQEINEIDFELQSMKLKEEGRE